METFQNTDNEPLQVANFDSRFLALLIDFVILSPVNLLLYFIQGSSKAGLLTGQIIWVAVFFVYNIYLVKRFNATPGKLIMKIKVVRSDGGSVGWKEAFLRESIIWGILLINLAVFLSIYSQLDYQAYIETSFYKKSKYLRSLSPIYTYASYLSGIWTISDILYYVSNNRIKALHDHIAGTLVIRTNPYKIFSSQ